MSSSHYCLATAGDGWGTRLSEAVLAGCVPLLAQPAVLMPFEDILAYERFSLRLAPEEVAPLPTWLATWLATEDPPCMPVLTTARNPPFPTGRIAADVADPPRARRDHTSCLATGRAPRLRLEPYRPRVQPDDPLAVPPGSRARRSVAGGAERQLCLARGSAARRHARDPSFRRERRGRCEGGCGGRCAGRHTPHSRLVPSRARTCRREGHCSAPPSQSPDGCCLRERRASVLDSVQSSRLDLRRSSC